MERYMYGTMEQTDGWTGTDAYVISSDNYNMNLRSAYCYVQNGFI